LPPISAAQTHSQPFAQIPKSPKRALYRRATVFSGHNRRIIGWQHQIKSTPQHDIQAQPKHEGPSLPNRADAPPPRLLTPRYRHVTPPKDPFRRPYPAHLSISKQNLRSRLSNTQSFASPLPLSDKYSGGGAQRRGQRRGQRPTSLPMLRTH
jgi:hypothetical protein